MADQVLERGSRIELNATVTCISRGGNRVDTITYIQGGKLYETSCRAVINTLPINEAIMMMQPSLGRSVEDATRALKFRALVFVGLLVQRETVLPSSFMYFRQHSFNRISDLAQFGFHITPNGHTLLVAEISCDVRDRPWNDDEFAKESVLADLVAENLLTREQVIETHVFRARHAYPMYTLHYETQLEVLLRAIAEIWNMETAGRQGRFQYVNTHIAMKMGYQAADRLIAGLESKTP